jgi:hypothetical protein
MHLLLRKTVKAALVLVLVLGGTVATVLVVDGFKSQSMRDFCAGVSDSDTPAMVIKRAEEMGYLVFDATDRRGVVAVLNQRAPMFRHSCEIEFKDGKVVGTSTRMAD